MEPIAPTLSCSLKANIKKGQCHAHKESVGPKVGFENQMGYGF